MQVQGNTFVISGGGSGLGEATARLLAESGGNVIVADVNEEAAKKVAYAIGAQARAIVTDVTNEGQVKSAVDLAIETFGELHGAISCAGVGMAMRIISKAGPHSLDVFKTVIEINLVGTFNLMRLAADAMARQEPGPTGERGVLVNTASAAAFDGQIGQAAYSASKAGVVGMTLPVARDLARSAIRVVTIAPGLFDTPLLAMLPEENRKALAESVPFPNRLGKPHEYAMLVQQIIENPMLNGETIRLDGAIRMAPK